MFGNSYTIDSKAKIKCGEKLIEVASRVLELILKKEKLIETCY